MLHIPLTNLHLDAKQKPYKKTCLLMKNIRRVVWKKFRRMVIGLGRRTTEEIVKWNQMTALRFQSINIETILVKHTHTHTLSHTHTHMHKLNNHEI